MEYYHLLHRWGHECSEVNSLPKAAGPVGRGLSLPSSSAFVMQVWWEKSEQRRPRFRSGQSWWAGAKETLLQFSRCQPQAIAVMSMDEPCHANVLCPRRCGVEGAGLQGPQLRAGLAWEQQRGSSLISICWQHLITTIDNDQPVPK